MFNKSHIFWLVATSVIFTSMEAVGDIHVHAANQDTAIIAMDSTETGSERDCGECACLSEHQFGIEISRLRPVSSLATVVTASSQYLLSGDRAPPVTPPPIS